MATIELYISDHEDDVLFSRIKELQPGIKIAVISPENVKLTIVNNPNVDFIIFGELPEETIRDFIKNFDKPLTHQGILGLAHRTMYPGGKSAVFFSNTRVKKPE